METFYGNVLEALNALKKQGYTEDFNLRATQIECKAKNVALDPASFAVDAVYRFEGDTDPGDEAIVYAISSLDGTIKGTLVNGYGPSAEPIADALMARLNTHV